jgi:hypothetical protein
MAASKSVPWPISEIRIETRRPARRRLSVFSAERPATDKRLILRTHIIASRWCSACSPVPMIASLLASVRASARVATALAAAVRIAVSRLASIMATAPPVSASNSTIAPRCEDRPRAGLSGKRLTILTPKQAGSVTAPGISPILLFPPTGVTERRGRVAPPCDTCFMTASTTSMAWFIGSRSATSSWLRMIIAPVPFLCPSRCL